MNNTNADATSFALSMFFFLITVDFNFTMTIQYGGNVGIKKAFHLMKGFAILIGDGLC
jgi:hypothetical protein